MTTSSRIVPKLERKLGRPFDEIENGTYLLYRLIYPKGKTAFHRMQKFISKRSRQNSAT